MSLTPNLPKRTWLNEVILELGRQKPDTTPEQAVAIAAELWEEANDLTPEQAVGIYLDDSSAD